MNPTAIFWPMIAHVALVGFIYGVLRQRRWASVRTGEAKASQFRVRGNEPASSASVSGNLMNQFELPVLLHVVCISLFVTAGVSYLTLTLAWAFVATRIAHTGFALYGNRLRYRAPAFFASAGVMGLLWLVFALHIAGLV